MQLKQFLELFNPYPGNNFIEVSTKLSETTVALKNLLNQTDSTLELVFYSQNESKLPDTFQDSKVQTINTFEKTFRAFPRSADIIILKDIFYIHKNKDLLLKTSYHALANTANIIIMEKKDILDKNEMYQFLEKYEFRATNFIDIIDGYDLVMAKKMHMWGNGL